MVRTMPVEASEIATLVPMPHLLESLGFDVNGRTKRCPCLLHGGSNPSAFSWTDAGLWRCHSCGAGGDKISLVRAVRNCSFREAVEFLAALAGIELGAIRMNRTAIDQVQAEQAAVRRDASVALAVDSSSWQERRDTVLQLEAIQRNAGRRLQEIGEGLPERWCGETDWCWGALAEVSRQMPDAAAAYAIASFGKFRDRLGFALDPRVAKRLIAEALDAGHVADDRGYRFEVIL
jgi:CHC2 zinc finger